jgi:tetratricopeptide (TPR) repeat protein
MQLNAVLFAFGLTLFAGLSTGIGSLLALLTKITSTRFLSVALGFSAGFMIYVSLIEIFAESRNTLISVLGPVQGSWATAAAFFAGMILIAVIDRLVPKVENPHEARHIEDMLRKECIQGCDRQKLMRLGFMSALAISPNYDQANANLCRTYIVEGQDDKALPFCIKAIERNPRMDDVYNLLGNMFFSRDKHAAISLYKKSIEAKPRNERAYYNLCTTYLSMKEYGSAVKACLKAIEIDPEFADAYSNLGNVYLATGNQKEALASYRKALELNPDIAAAHNNLATIYLYAKQYDLAIYHIDRAIALGHKVHPDILAMLKQYRKK